MKGYYVYKDWLIRLVIGILFIFGTIIFMLIEKTNKIPLFIYIILLSTSFLFVLVMTILVLANKEKFLTKIYLYNDYIEIKNNFETIHKINLNKIKTIKTRKEDYTTFLVIEFYLENSTKTIEVEYNKNIVFYFSQEGWYENKYPWKQS